MLNGIRSVLRRLDTALRWRFSSGPTPAEVVETVKNNTREAFEYFWRQERYINNQYLDASRLEFYDIVAACCDQLLSGHQSGDMIRIVDIGCGSGHMLHILHSKLRHLDLELFGLDYANSAVAAARRLLPSATIILGDIFDNCFRSEYFDFVLSVETFEHLRDPERALVQAVRLAKPGGTLVLTVPNGDKDDWEGHQNFWNQQQFADFLSCHGPVSSRLVQSDTVIVGILSKPAAKTAVVR